MRRTIATSTISKGRGLTVPTAVMKYFGATAGDQLDWVPATIDIPDKELDDFLLVRVHVKDEGVK